MMKQINVKIDIKENEYTDADSENIWCTSIKNTYIVDSIPVFSNNISLGDEIDVKNNNEDLFFRKILKKSGNKTIRLYFPENIPESIKSEILYNLNNLGCSYEGYYGYLFGVNVPKGTDEKKIITFLEKNIKNIFYEKSDF